VWNERQCFLGLSCINTWAGDKQPTPGCSSGAARVVDFQLDCHHSGPINFYKIEEALQQNAALNLADATAQVKNRVNEAFLVIAEVLT